MNYAFIEGGRIGLKGLNRYSPGQRPGLGNSSDTVHYRPEKPKQIYDLTIYNLRFRCTQFMIEEGCAHRPQVAHVETHGRASLR